VYVHRQTGHRKGNKYRGMPRIEHSIKTQLKYIFQVLVVNTSDAYCIHDDDNTLESKQTIFHLFHTGVKQGYLLLS
jgi:hypothetical protein